LGKNNFNVSNLQKTEGQNGFAPNSIHI